MSKFLLSIDDVELANEVNKILIQNGFDVVGELQHEKEFAQIIERKPDFVIMSIMNYQSKNWKLQIQIRTSQEIEQFPILVINSNSFHDDRIDGLISTRLDDYINYPFDLAEFLFKIRYLLDRATSTNQT